MPVRTLGKPLQAHPFFRSTKPIRLVVGKDTLYVDGLQHECTERVLVVYGSTGKSLVGRRNDPMWG